MSVSDFGFRDSSFPGLPGPGPIGFVFPGSQRSSPSQLSILKPFSPRLKLGPFCRKAPAGLGLFGAACSRRFAWFAARITGKSYSRQGIELSNEPSRSPLPNGVAIQYSCIQIIPRPVSGSSRIPEIHPLKAIPPTGVKVDVISSKGQARMEKSARGAIGGLHPPADSSTAPGLQPDSGRNDIGRR